MNENRKFSNVDSLFSFFSVRSDLLSSGYVERHLSEKGRTVVTSVRFCKSSLLVLTHAFTTRLFAVRMDIKTPFTPGITMPSVSGYVERDKIM